MGVRTPSGRAPPPRPFPSRKSRTRFTASTWPSLFRKSKLLGILWTLSSVIFVSVQRLLGVLCFPSSIYSDENENSARRTRALWECLGKRDTPKRSHQRRLNWIRDCFWSPFSASPRDYKKAFYVETLRCPRRAPGFTPRRRDIFLSVYRLCNCNPRFRFQGEVRRYSQDRHREGV